MSFSQSAKDEPEWEEVTPLKVMTTEEVEEMDDENSNNETDSDTIEEVDKDLSERDDVDENNLLVIKIKATAVALALNSFTTTALYPIEFARTLMKAGYEPREPVAGLSLIGRPCLTLPNLFQYIRYIQKVDGISGCYRGIFPYLLYRSVDMIVFLHFKLPASLRTTIRPLPQGVNETEKLKDSENIFESPTPDDKDKCKCRSFRSYFGNAVLDIIGCGVAAIVSYPLRVVSIHCMATFVESQSSNVIEVVKGIWNTDGFSGFFKGLVPKLIGDVVGVVAVCVVTFLIKLRISDPDAQKLLTIFVSPLTAALQYPFGVVSTTMAINRTKRAIGGPPITPYFSDWRDCWDYLNSLHQLRRGSSFVFRYYTGPVLNVHGVLRPTVIYFGPDLTKSLDTSIRL